MKNEIESNHRSKPKAGTEMYDVLFEDGSIVTIFNPNLVTSKA